MKQTKKEMKVPKEYLQVGYMTYKYSNKIAISKVPLFLCLDEVKEEVSPEMQDDTIKKVASSIVKPYQFECERLTNEGYELYELKEGKTLRDTTDSKAKLTYEVASYIGLRNEKGEFTKSFRLYYQILISPKKDIYTSARKMVSSYSEIFYKHYEKEIVDFIRNNKILP